jgi:hypothetical protein
MEEATKIYRYLAADRSTKFNAALPPSLVPFPIFSPCYF